MDGLLSGLVVAVTNAPVGTQVAAAAVSGATVLLLDDTIDINPTGGQVTIDAGTPLGYTASDDDASTITLAVALTAALAEGAEVLVYPPMEDVTALTLIQGASDPIPATVPHNLRDALPVGVREEEDRETVRLTRDGEWSLAIFDVVGAPLLRDGSYIDPATMPSYFDFTGPIAVDQLTEGVLSARVQVAGDGLTTRAVDATGALTGPGQDLSMSGFYSYGPVSGGQETRRVEMPADPALPNVFRGNAYLDDVTMQKLTLLLALSLAEGAVFTLQTGVQPPPPPSVQFGYTSQQFTDDGLWPNRSGWSTDGTHWYTTRLTSSGALYLEKWAAAGTLSSSISAAAGAVVSSASCVVGGGNVYLLFNYGGTNFWEIWRFTTALVYVTYHPWNDADGTRTPAIGWDAADATNPLLIAQSKASDDKVTIRRYPIPANGAALVQAVFRTHDDSTYPYPLSTLLAGSFDLGAGRFVFSSGVAGHVFRAVVTSTGNYPTGDPDSWPSGMQSGKVGLAWNGTNFRSMDKTGMMRTYEAGAGNRWTAAADATWDAGVAYYSPTGPTETLATTFRFTMQKRARLTITGPVLPVGGTVPATQVRFFLKRGTAAHVAGDLWLQGAVTPAAGQPASLTVANAVFTGTADRTTSTFGTGVPSSLQAASGGFTVNAQSNGSLGTGTFRSSVTDAATDHRCLVSRSTATVTVTATYTLVEFDVEDNDPAGIHASGLFTVPAGGIYRIVATVQFGASSLGDRRILRINKNAATVSDPDTFAFAAVPPLAAGSTPVNVAWEGRLAAADVLRAWVWQNSGGNLNVNTLYGHPSLSLRKVAP